MFNKNDIYVSGGVNRRDFIYLIVVLLFSLLIIFNQTVSTDIKSFGNIYSPILLLSLIIIGLSIAFKGHHLFNEVIFGKLDTDKDFTKTLIISIAVGLILGFTILSSQSTLSFINFTSGFAPLTITASSSVLLLIAIDCIIAPDIEENFISASIIPTINSALANTNLMAIIGLFGGFVFYFIFDILPVSLVFFAIGIIFLFSKLSNRKIISGEIPEALLSIAFGAFIFASFHLWAYQNSYNILSLLTTAFAFSFSVNLMNRYLQNTIGSRIVHSITNASILITSGVVLYSVMLGVAVYIIIIITIWKASSRLKGTSPTQG